jgi:hypothetical protein
VLPDAAAGSRASPGRSKSWTSVHPHNKATQENSISEIPGTNDNPGTNIGQPLPWWVS